MLNDLLAAIRGLRKVPSFTLVALSVLALGIGTATGRPTPWAAASRRHRRSWTGDASKRRPSTWQP
jgi:hypothetical protein